MHILYSKCVLRFTMKTAARFTISTCSLYNEPIKSFLGLSVALVGRLVGSLPELDSNMSFPDKKSVVKSNKVPSVNVGNLIKGQYEIVSALGHGGFGAVFKVRDDKSKQFHALKIEFEKPKEDEAGIELEVSVLKLLQNNKHFLKYIDSGKLDENHYVIMQLAGKNLADLRKACPNKHFTSNTTYRIAEQCLDAIEAMHGSGLLHRDVKPANFAMGCTDKDAKNVYLLDFGLVRQYRVKDGTLRAPRHKCGFRGTIKYASINCHKNMDVGRHDDIWCWLYMLFEFLKGNLPWQPENDKNKVLEVKLNAKNKLLEETEPEMTQIYASLAQLTYFDEPPYHTYRAHMFRIMQRKEFKSNDPFDWEQGGAYYKEATAVCDQPYKKVMKSKEKTIREKDKDDKD